ncbi:tyrosinase family protein [Singulisphaera sp. GP187]|uniref:tyrosinase family protein n=1 Tax=Singulisphaera sp. GP187 TaxID=1882752 RepID=UPI001C1FFDF0|nr:tyrosinase family protein [Singulisphaera sp. GP187]
MSRREFLVASGTAVLASGVKAGSARAQAGTPPYVRRNVTDPMTAATLQSYKNAITAMLNLPPTDPRNWYRNALIHLLDCPHGNWWLLPWHRGYIGWFEQTCRALSGDSNFALPYWDWTAGPYIPSAFTDNSVLNPANPAFIDGYAAFQQQFTDPVNTFYAGLTSGQQNELSLRGMATPADFWSNASGALFPSSQARQPNFDPTVLNSVALSTILDALAPATFLDFGSDKAQAHSEMVGFGILEGQPHNNIHNAVGGDMSEFLSPVDPIFFMHHSNIDRLWDVWTRKQQAQNLPTLPEGADLAAWQNEPFLFYINSAGQSVPNGKAGDYATIGPFNYTYQPGSGENVVQQAAPRLLAQKEKIFQTTLSKTTLDFQQPMTATGSVPAALTHPAAAVATPPLFARITLQPPENRRGVRLHVLVNSPEGARNVGFSDPSFAGTITFFGSHGHGHMAGPVSFDVPLTEALKRLRAAGRLKVGEPLRIQVVPDTQGVTLSTFQVPVKSISIGTL